MRKKSLICMVISLVALFALWTGLATAQAAAGDKPVTLESILKAGGAPLTADQQKKLNELDLTKGREAFAAINEMFTEQQMTALKKALGTQPGRNGGPETPRALRQLIALEKVKAPLTEKQVAAIKALPSDQNVYQQLNDILTDKQKEEMQKIFPRRQ
jgi:hypothetical protein